MKFDTGLLGSHFILEKGISYKGDELVESCEVGLVTLDSFRPGGGYKTGSEKPFDGGFKPSFVLAPGDVVIATTDVTQDGAVLCAPALIPNYEDSFSELVWSLDVAKLLPTTGDVRPEYLYNFFRIPLNRKRAAYGDTGTTVRRIPFDAMYKQVIPIPSIEEQDRINSFIATLDRKIELNTAMAANLEKIAQSIFRSWFVDFDPVKAKMAGEKPVGMDDATAALFPDSFEDSELGPIPSGWKLQSLSNIGEFRNGLAMQKFPVVDVENVLPVIKIAQLRAGNTTGADLASGLIDPKFVVSDGDVLFSWSGTLEIEHWAGGPGALNQHLFKVLGKTVPNWFIFSSSRSHLPEFRKIASGKATTMGHIQRSHLDEAKTAVPPAALLEKVDGLLSALVAQKVSLLVENRTLAELRDALLPRLISGELQIPEEMLVS